MTVTDQEAVTGAISIAFQSACDATDHNVYWGDLASVGSYAYDGAACSAGASGSATFNPGSGSYSFVIACNNGAVEASYGHDWTGAERPEYVDTPVCPLPQALTAVCE